ncbi:autotransporter outer membrane beta-barrel domain-containing protein [Hymenobacter jeollabukensis]|uniref:Autotransporter outer membrane beta-barrel domain-containing protein n=1 Tax=Hymenobacter jeollabukensis TaxID=2025313 RepID=A0A5R8WNP4_9BACT|nr:autotransporter outer membrane beta-barrel domain-containing protein [Hymenobacter jeollabukensis]TLM91664.1 autotransporter outer membrane beta-barrel domain-containing protein [Hymenobacter jeollabukensis]
MVTRVLLASIALATPLLTTHTARAQAPSSAPASRTHQVKLGVQAVAGLSGIRPTLAYEWQVAPQFALEVSGSYSGSSSSSGYDYVFSPDSIYSYRSTIRQRQLAAGVHGRYNFSSRQPALIGWYADLGLQGNYYFLRHTVTAGEGPTYSRQRFDLTPQVRIGRQWALGQRLSLDTYLGLERSRSIYTLSFASPQFLHATAGLQLSYRF